MNNLNCSPLGLTDQKEASDLLCQTPLKNSLFLSAVGVGQRF